MSDAQESLPMKSTPSVTFLSRLDVRLRRSSLRLTAAASEDSKASIPKSPNQDSPAVASETERSPCSSVSTASRGIKVQGGLSSRVREGAASESPTKVAPAAANALCKALVDLERVVASTAATAAGVQGGSTALKSYQDQLATLVSLCDIVARGALLCCDGATRAGEGGGLGEEESRYKRSLETLRVYAERGKEIVAPLCSKGTLARLSRYKKIRRDLDTLGVSVADFAANHNPELATNEDKYVSSLFGYRLACREVVFSPLTTVSRFCSLVW